MAPSLRRGPPRPRRRRAQASSCRVFDSLMLGSTAVRHLAVVVATGDRLLHPRTEIVTGALDQDLLVRARLRQGDEAELRHLEQREERHDRLVLDLGDRARDALAQEAEHRAEREVALGLEA